MENLNKSKEFEAMMAGIQSGVELSKYKLEDLAHDGGAISMTRMARMSRITMPVFVEADLYYRSLYWNSDLSQKFGIRTALYDRVGAFLNFFAMNVYTQLLQDEEAVIPFHTMTIDANNGESAIFNIQAKITKRTRNGAPAILLFALNSPLATF
jgi:hypothetical protein